MATRTKRKQDRIKLQVTRFGARALLDEVVREGLLEEMALT